MAVKSKASAASVAKRVHLKGWREAVALKKESIRTIDDKTQNYTWMQVFLISVCQTSELLQIMLLLCVQKRTKKLDGEKSYMYEKAFEVKQKEECR